MDNKISAPWRMSFDTDYTYFLENDYGTLGEVTLWNEDDANKISRLISLAPEMADALRECVRQIEVDTEIMYGEFEEKAMVPAALTKARALLAKLEAE